MTGQASRQGNPGRNQQVDCTLAGDPGCNQKVDCTLARDPVCNKKVDCTLAQGRPAAAGLGPW
eukprot:1803810-Heterocapsa_arctica.AAC.1